MLVLEPIHMCFATQTQAALAYIKQIPVLCFGFLLFVVACCFVSTSDFVLFVLNLYNILYFSRWFNGFAQRLSLNLNVCSICVIMFIGLRLSWCCCLLDVFRVKRVLFLRDSFIFVCVAWKYWLRLTLIQKTSWIVCLNYVWKKHMVGILVAYIDAIFMFHAVLPGRKLCIATF